MTFRKSSEATLLPAKDLFPIAVILGVFAASRIYYYLMGVRFDWRTINYYWQYLPVELLKNNLLQSLYYLHHEPPFFDLFLGLILKISPGHYPSVFHGIYIFFGLSFCITLYYLLKKVGVHPWLAVFIAVAFMCRPVMILYENWLFYEYPVALMLCLSAVFLHRFIEVESSGDALIFFSILACLALTRCIFNAAYLVAAAALIIFFKKGLLKKVLRTAVIPLVIVLLFNAKDYCLFGKMSFGEVDLKQSVLFFLKKGMTQYQITLLQKDGKLSPIFQIPEFSQVSSYLPYVHVENTGIPALDIADKGNGFPNFNNIIYLKVPHLYFHDALTITKKYPFDAIKMVLQHHENYFSPASFIWPYTAGPREYLGHTAVNNYRAVKPMAVMYDMVLLWDKGRLKGASPVLLAILPLLVIYALLLARRSLAGPQRNESLGITLLFMLIMVAVDALASILTWDPQRFRFDVDSYYVVFFALLINDLAARMRTQRDGATRRIA